MTATVVVESNEQRCLASLLEETAAWSMTATVVVESNEQRCQDVPTEGLRPVHVNPDYDTMQASCLHESSSRSAPPAATSAMTRVLP